tara:strand:+ start:471 stop:2201 length:1731 start_codon:yes stop_codon:yes gene_type:complete
MAIDFPASPNANQTFTVGSITYKWDGAKWIGLGVTPADRLVEGSNSLELDANNDLVYTAPGTLKVNSADAAGYIAEFNQTNASNSGQILINSPTDGNSRPSLMDFARGGTVKFSVGMGYNDANNGFLISAGGSLASNITNAVFRITPDGKTGIGNYAANGTEVPTSLLHVNTNWDNGDVPMVHFKGANNEAPQSGTENISFQISDENSNVLHKVWNTGGGNNDFGYVSYSGDMAVGANFTPDSALEVRDSAATGVIIRCTNTQTTDSNKALRIRNNSGSNTFSISHKGLISVNGADGTSADTALFRNTTSGGNNRVRINTVANGGGHPYMKFDAGGSNMVVGEYYQGTTSNQLVLGVGEDPTDTKGITINGLAQVVIGDYSMNSEILRVKGGEADIWLDSSTSGIWRILGSTGGNTHMFRVYDNTNSADRLNINASGRVRLPGIVGVAGSNLANVSVEADGNLCTTTSIRAAKTNISPLADTSWLFDLNPVTFNWRTKTESEDGTLTWGEEADGGTQYGLIAEEVEEVKDDFCYYNNDGELSGVHYDRLVAPLLKVVQQQKEEIEALKARLDAGGL